MDGWCRSVSLLFGSSISLEYANWFEGSGTDVIVLDMTRLKG